MTATEQHWKTDDSIEKALAESYRADELESGALLEGVDRVYSTSEAAEFFGRSNQWLYWGMRNKIFVYADGKEIEPERIGGGRRRRFTLPIIRDIALSCYHRGNFKKPELIEILRRIKEAELGYDVKETPDA